MVDAREIFHALRWQPKEALQLLRDVPQLESAGVVVRMPASWRTGRPPRPQVTGRVGGGAPSGLGKDALLDFRMEVTLNGETLTAGEIRELLAKSDGLVLVRGRWVEVDRERLSRMVEHFDAIERTAAESGLSFRQAMRMLAGAPVGSDGASGGTDPDWAQVIAGPWLAETLKGLRSPEGLAFIDPGAALHGNPAALPTSRRTLALPPD
jgi:non-specific serine/threonine protein kinase